MSISTQSRLTCFLLAVAAATVIWCQLAEAKQREMLHLKQDLEEYRAVAPNYVDPVDKQFLSDLALQTIYKEWALWFNSERTAELNDVMAGAYAQFVLIQWDIRNPTRTAWGLGAFWTHDSLYMAHEDTGVVATLREKMNQVKKEMLPAYGGFSVFNELIPGHEFEGTHVSILPTDGPHDAHDRYVISAAEKDLNRWLREGVSPFPIYLPLGKYDIVSESGVMFTKSIEPRLDSLQFIYLTPNVSFTFEPWATVVDTVRDTSYVELLDTVWFELIRIGEDKDWEQYRSSIDKQRISDFDQVEYGRYLFRVKPPYRLVDNHPSKLILPIDDFGPGYLERENELFDKKSYQTSQGIHEILRVRPGEKLIYAQIERTLPLPSAKVETPPSE